MKNAITPDWTHVPMAPEERAAAISFAARAAKRPEPRPLRSQEEHK